MNSYSILVKDLAAIDSSRLGLVYGPGAGDSVIGASYGGSGGRDVDELFAYAGKEEDIIGNAYNE